jgi:copper chaperone CopZ
MSMEDLFYGPPENTWILPTRDDRPYYRERDFSPPRRFHHPEPLRPVERYQPRPVLPRNDIRPVVRVPPPPVMEGELRPVERMARVHTVPEPIRVHEEIRKVVEEPVVRSAVPVPTQVVTEAPRVVAPKPAPPPPVQVVQQKRSVSPPRAIVHHPIELKVPMCCEKCARKVKERLVALEGVNSVVTDQYNQKVTVHGNVDPSRVLNQVKRVKKRSVFWDITVDYSENYRRARQVEDAALERERTKAAVAKNEAAKSIVTPAVPKVVVNMPPDHHGPAVQAVLPEMNPMRVHQARYETPVTGFRQEFVHGPREEMMMRNPEFHHHRH